MTDLLAGRYELGRTLGSGGMARVVEAHDHHLDRQVAIKLMRETADDAARRRFLGEARSAARFHHPNAVAVFDTGGSDGTQPWIAMELVHGRTLAEVIADGGPLPVDEVVEITSSVLAALAAAHRQGMVHRDIKPANILLPDEGGVKLVDFGIAKGLRDLTAGLTGTGMLVGTATYLSPEQVEGEAATPASDVYSAGVVAYEMLTGSPPFTGESAVAVAYAHVSTPPPRLEEQRDDVPGWLLAVVASAMAKDPAERYADAGEMREALRDRTAVLPAGAAATTMAAAGHGAGDDVPPPPPMRPRTVVREPEHRPGESGRRVLGWLIAVTVAILGLVILLSVADDLFAGVPAPGVDEPPPAEQTERDQGEPDDGGAEQEDQPEPSEPEQTDTEPSETGSPDGGVLDDIFDDESS